MKTIGRLADEVSSLALGPVKEAPACTLYHTVYSHRKNSCKPCQKADGGKSWSELRKQSVHSCVMKTGDVISGNGPVTEEEWKLATDKLKKELIIEAFCLCKKIGSCRDVCELKVEMFLETNCGDLLARINEYFQDMMVFNQNVFEYAN